MIEIDIPGFGEVRLKHFVTDFSGTLSLDGRILTKLKDRLDKLAEEIEIH
ncbi:MAG: ATPase P, partial [Candidatus Zixiibacteriota bacterium]